MSKYGVISGPYFRAFGLNMERYESSQSKFRLNAEKYGPEITQYLDTFHAVEGSWFEPILLPGSR